MVETTPCTPQCKMYNDREKCPRNKNMISTEAKTDATEIGRWLGRVMIAIPKALKLTGATFYKFR